MKLLEHADLPRLLAELARALPDGPPLRVYLAGGAAGILGHLLAPARVTTDCDAIGVVPESASGQLLEAAAKVAARHGLPEAWFNDKAKRFAWQLPLGWLGRAVHHGTYGRLECFLLSRQDLIAAKVMGAADARPHDLEDLAFLVPSDAEVAFVLDHLDRLEAEDLDRNAYDAERAIIQAFGRRNP